MTDAPAERVPNVPVGAYSLVHLVSRDADEQAEQLKRWDQDYEQLTPGRFRGELTDLWLSNLQLFRETTNQSVHEAGTPWRGSRAFGVPLHMEGAARFCGKAIDADSILTLEAGEELDFRTPSVLDIVGIGIPGAELDEYALEVDGAAVTARLRGRRLLPAPGERMSELRQVLASVFDSIGRDLALLHHAHSRRTLRHAVLGSLLTALGGAGDEPSALPSYPNRRRVVDQARAYVIGHRDQPVTVAELCRMLGTSRRTLQYCFQEVLDTNPVQYLRAIRLNGARRELKVAAQGSCSVQDVAARWGFWHLSHFAADYRRMFGELPSETLRT